MSSKYKFRDNDALYFVSFAVVNWIDLFIRPEYAEIFLISIRFCQREKGMQLYGWCLMTSHTHLIIGVKDNSFSDLMRDFKRHTSEKFPSSADMSFFTPSHRATLARICRPGLCVAYLCRQ